MQKVKPTEVQSDLCAAAGAGEWSKPNEMMKASYKYRRQLLIVDLGAKRPRPTNEFQQRHEKPLCVVQGHAEGWVPLPAKGLQGLTFGIVCFHRK
jgi:hypothetical protein